MKIIFATDELPKAGSAGHLAFNAALVEWLRGQGHDVVIMLVRPRLRWPIERFANFRVAGPGIIWWHGFVVSLSPRHIAAILVRRVLAALPAHLAQQFRKRGRAGQYGIVDAVLGAFMAPAQMKYCQQRLVAMQPDVILVDTIFRAAVLDDPALASVKTLILAHDVFHLRHQILTGAGYQVYPATLSREFEAGLLNKAHGIISIQPEEAAQFRAMCPAIPVYVASMPATACPRPAHIARLARRLVFVGGDGLPNLDGLRWFFTKVWPHLHNNHPLITLDLIGDCANAYGTLPAGVNRLGRIANLAPYLHKASLAISPLRVGTGLKIKLLDYARHGLTTIATPLSLQGFATDPRAPFIAAADPVSFYAAILQSLQHTPNAAAELNAINYVEKHYGKTTVFRELTVALKKQ